MTKEELRLQREKYRLDNRCIHCGQPLFDPSTRNRSTCNSCHYIGRLANGEGGWRWILMRQVLDNYGYICRCCGEKNPLMLSIDHTEGGGNVHRKQERKTSNEWLKAVIAEGFPDTYQVLCFNCNMSKNRTKDGRCAHELERRDFVD